MATPGVPDFNTVQISCDSERDVHCGEKFEANCRMIWEDPYVNLLQPGTQIQLWDGGIFASGVVLEVYPENWDATWGERG